MSAAYRIEVQRNLHMQGWPWEANVYPLTGTLAGFPAAYLTGKTRGEAVAAARAWILDQRAHEADAEVNHATLYVDEGGQDVPPPTTQP